MSFTASLREYQSQSAQQWLDRATRTLPQALSVVLVVAIAWQLVQLTWLLFQPAPQLEPLSLEPSGAPLARPKGVDVQAIVAANLFGNAEQAAPVQEGPAPDTQLNLVLSAVFAAEQPDKGLAIIGDSPQQAKVFSVGDPVRSGTRLHAVYADRVILDRSGQLETLALPKPKVQLAASRAPAPPPQANRLVDDLRRIAETNPTAFAEIVRPQPVFANGVQRGYRVYPGRNRQQFSKLGLRPGDLVISINGTSLDDPQRSMEIFNTMGTSDQVQVTIERNGQPQELTLNTAQITLPEAAVEPPEGGRPGPSRAAPPGFSPTPTTQ